MRTLLVCLDTLRSFCTSEESILRLREWLKWIVTHERCTNIVGLHEQPENPFISNIAIVHFRPGRLRRGRDPDVKQARLFSPPPGLRGNQLDEEAMTPGFWPSHRPVEPTLRGRLCHFRRSVETSQFGSDAFSGCAAGCGKNCD